MLSELIFSVKGGLGSLTGGLDGGVLLLVMNGDLGEVCAALPPLCSPLARRSASPRPPIPNRVSLKK